ncbi:hypothetical protein [Cellvibrio sp. QJXJ]|uniref:hypothetical protein n=1 Tax=Cellvibrio sp. QJXJ TaxID=2964606 RepID=UPI0021C26F57|nr:hypothetical protein [Cellvibrio sp. QJXJ]UUA75160.1 hypothetical protein NNX04_22140 [Cellvibrio sp. QJXJ]
MENPIIEKESFIQRWAPHLVAGILVVAVGFYMSKFHHGLSTDQGTWGEFGDFVGGAVNPIIGFFTIWLLAVSLRQNHRALRQANTALTQANAELELTREAIKDARGMQAATEAALKHQTAIASEARDLTNAAILFKYADEHYVNRVDRHSQLPESLNDSPDAKMLIEEAIIFDGLRVKMGKILSLEADRLIIAHSLSQSEGEGKH